GSDREGWRLGRATAAPGDQQRHQRDDQQACAHRRDQTSAAVATALATAGPTRGSSGLGTMYSGARSSPTTAKIASAAATFIFSVILRAPASSAPRNTPGNASTLLIWLRKSLRPVATTAACLAASSGWISGSGLDSANTMPLGAIVAISSSGTIPPDS